MSRTLLSGLAWAALAGAATLARAEPASAPAAATPSPAAALQAAAASDWVPFDPADLLVIELANGARVVIALADPFAPVHIANIRSLARSHWYDGRAVERVQEDYVAQWGDPDGKAPLPAAIAPHPPAEYDRPAAGLAFQPLPYRDAYAPAVGAVGAFPVARAGPSAWLAHCYAMVGVGRDLNPDTGTGAELYAVIGQPARGLDRNVAVVGRVVAGMEALSSLPRGTGKLGFYETAGERLAIRRVRLASDLPPADQPRLQWLRPDSAGYHAWIAAKANRRDDFFVRPSGAVELCQAMPPIRPAPP